MEKIERIGDYEVLIDGIKYIKDKNKPEPEFKAGQWVIGRGDDFPHEPRRITSIRKDGTCRYADNIIEDEENNGQTFYYLRPATSAEIISHLRKICDKKYIGKKVRCLVYPQDELIIDRFVEYLSCEDKIIYKAINCKRMCLYEQGKFAEIIPDKKKLPKAKIEFVEFLKDYNIELKDCDDEFTINKFLNQYED